MKSPIISALVTFHAEGRIASDTLQGMERLRRHAERHNFEVEFVVVLDCANLETIATVKSCSNLRNTDQVVEVVNRDLGASRNSGIQIARGNYIGIFDGDDFYSENWLTEALKLAQASDDKLIIHPELQISFGGIHCVARLPDMQLDPSYPLQNCLAVHPWTSCSFASRSIYESSPYCRSDTSETGFGFEDWHWNLETMAKGAIHTCAYGTALFYRRKNTSMLTEMVASGAIIRPSLFFDQPNQWGPVKSSNTIHEIAPTMRSDEELLPDWTLCSFLQIAKIEPQLLPTLELFSKFVAYDAPLNLEPGELYAKIHERICGFQPHEFWLLSYPPSIGALKKIYQDIEIAQSRGRKILIIVTDPYDSPPVCELPRDVVLIEFGNISKVYTEEQKGMVLIRLMLQSSANEIFLINSFLAQNVVNRHFKSIIAIGKKIFICENKCDQA